MTSPSEAHRDHINGTPIASTIKLISKREEKEKGEEGREEKRKRKRKKYGIRVPRPDSNATMTASTEGFESLTTKLTKQ